MSDREADIEKFKVQLGQWNGDLYALDAELLKTAPDLKFHYEEQIKELRKKVEAAEQIFADIREKDEDAWSDIKKATETTWNDLKESFSKVKSEFKNGYQEGSEE